MEDLAGAFTSGLESGRKLGEGGTSGLSAVLSAVVGKLKQQEALKQEMNQKKNLLGYSGLTEGKIVQAQQGEAGAF